MIPPDNLPIYYILGILNSSLMEFFMKRISETSGMGVLRWIKNNVEELPIPDYEGEHAEQIAHLARLASSRDLSEEEREDYRRPRERFVLFSRYRSSTEKN